jgi:hypothetical protein
MLQLSVYIFVAKAIGRCLAAANMAARGEYKAKVLVYSAIY